MKHVIIYFLFILNVINLSAQISESTVKAGLIFRLTESIEWPSEGSIKKFTFGVLSNDSIIIKELKNVATLKKVKKKNVEVLINDEIVDYSALQGIFIDYDHINYLNAVAKQISNKKGILIVTYNSPELLLSMINIYKDNNDSTLRFKINKQNLDNGGFKYKHDLLLYGGTIMDIKDLFILTNEQLSEKTSQIDSINKQLSSLKKESRYYSERIQELSVKMQSALQQVKEREKEVTVLSNDIYKKDSELLKVNKELETQLYHQKTLAGKLHNTLDSISLVEKKLNQLNVLLEEKKKQVAESRAVINSQNVKIKKQEKGLFWLVVVGAILLILVTIVIIALNIKRRLARRLSSLVDARTKELYESQQYYLGLFNDSPVAIGEFDLSATLQYLKEKTIDFDDEQVFVEATEKVRIIDVNNKMQELFDAENKDMLINNYYKLFNNESLKGLKMFFEKLMLGEKHF
ncbi:MAG: DUF4154 domain-containing protein, partial [Chlorobi bacterium]|nr:DUF4154 domain-containing protein [Chlorobiota bacterium]